MANQEHLEILGQGVKAWNTWRQANPDIEPQFRGAHLHGAHLHGAHLRGAHLNRADLRSADLSGADLGSADLSRADLRGTDLGSAKLRRADLGLANLSNTNLVNADLYRTNLGSADFSRADLRGADFNRAVLIDTNLEGAVLTGCHIYGISAWNIKGTPKDQTNLIITRENEPTVTVDDLEVAQFVYLLLSNKKVRNVIDTITSKVVLILGRFTPERKAALDALREALRHRAYVPILFDFDRAANLDVTETITLLARMARFIVADLTDSASIPKELEAIVPHVAVPVQPLIQGTNRPYSMFKDYWKYSWVLKEHRYEQLDDLLVSLTINVIEPAEAKAKELVQRRNEAYR